MNREIHQFKTRKGVSNLFEFECWHEFNGEPWGRHSYIAKTRAKAKSQHYHYLQDGLFEGDFFDVVKGMKCRKIGIASIVHFFGDPEKFKRVKAERGIDFAFQGMKISVDGFFGTIVGGNDSLNLDVVMDGNWYVSNCHPWWETIYYDNQGNIIADYRAKAVESISS